MGANRGFKKRSVEFFSYGVMALFLVACQESKTSLDSSSVGTSSAQSYSDSALQSVGAVSGASSEEGKSDERTSSAEETSAEDSARGQGSQPQSNGNGGAGFLYLFLGMGVIGLGASYIFCKTNPDMCGEKGAYEESQRYYKDKALSERHGIEFTAVDVEPTEYDEYLKATEGHCEETSSETASDIIEQAKESL